MAQDLHISNAAAQSMLTALGTSIDAGTAGVVNIYSGSVPADADAALGGATLLAQLTCNATVFTSVTDGGGYARATFAAITADTDANNTGTAAFFRILTQDAGTVVLQGTVGTADADLIMNTTAVAAGSTVTISAATIDLPEGP